jgi:hypothetical protein
VRTPRARRAGASLLEVQVAIVVLAVAVSGICPLVVMQARVVRKLETQPIGPDNPQVIRGVRMLNGVPFIGPGYTAPPTTVLQPQPDGWVRRLGVAASFALSAPAQAFTPLPVQTTLDDDAGSGFSATGWATASDASAIMRWPSARRPGRPHGRSRRSSRAGITSWPRGCRTL